MPLHPTEVEVLQTTFQSSCCLLDDADVQNISIQVKARDIPQDWRWSEEFLELIKNIEV